MFVLRRGRWTPRDGDGTVRAFADAREARAWLRLHVGVSSLRVDGDRTLRLLRRALLEAEPGRRVDAMTDDAVLDRLAHLLHTGRVQAIEPLPLPEYRLSRPEPEALERPPEAPVEEDGALWVHHDFETEPVTLAIDVDTRDELPALRVDAEATRDPASLEVDAEVEPTPWSLEVDAEVEPTPWSLAVDLDAQDAAVTGATEAEPDATHAAEATGDTPTRAETSGGETPWELVDPLAPDEAEAADETAAEDSPSETPWELVDPLAQDDSELPREPDVAPRERSDEPWELVDAEVSDE